MESKENNFRNDQSNRASRLSYRLSIGINIQPEFPWETYDDVLLELTRNFSHSDQCDEPEEDVFENSKDESIKLDETTIFEDAKDENIKLDQTTMLEDDTNESINLHETTIFDIANQSSVLEAFEAIELGRPATEEERTQTKKFMNEMETKTHEEVKQNDLLLFIVGKTLEENGINMVISKTKIKDDETMKLHTQLWLTGAIFDCKIYESKFTNDSIQNADQLKKDSSLEKTFINEFKDYISCLADVSPDDIQILSIQNGSIIVNFSSIKQLIFNNDTSNAKPPLNSVHMGTHEKKILDEILLNEEIFNHSYDMDYTSSFYKGRVEKRGQEDYHFPYGWKRFGLNLNYFTYFKKDDLSWLTMNNNDNEWCVAYHGIRRDPVNSLKSIINDKRGKPTIERGPVQRCKAKLDKNKRNIEGFGKHCGEGVYCTPKIETALGYTSPVKFDGKSYRIALQCRINPKKYRDAGGYFYVINDFVNDIRPYGILLKSTN